jgi:hypothetical protein
MTGLLLGSVSNAVVHSVRMPVIVARASESAPKWAKSWMHLSPPMRLRGTDLYRGALRRCARKPQQWHCKKPTMCGSESYRAIEKE